MKGCGRYWNDIVVTLESSSELKRARTTVCNYIRFKFIFFNSLSGLLEQPNHAAIEFILSLKHTLRHAVIHIHEAIMYLTQKGNLWKASM